MKCFLTKTGFQLAAADDAAQDILRKIKPGQTVRVEIRKPRNIRFHRLYFALIHKVWENLDSDHYPAPEDLHQALKVALGIRTAFRLKDGTQGYIPGSIAFDKMTEEEFSAFFDRVADKLVTEWLPGVTSEALKTEIEIMTGAKIA